MNDLAPDLGRSASDIVRLTDVIQQLEVIGDRGRNVKSRIAQFMSGSPES